MSKALMTASKRLRWAVPMLLAILAVGAVRIPYPSTADPGPPYYARIEWGFVIQDGTTAAIPFYRDPGCVPSGFNLLNLFDAPRAFGCPLTVEGFDIWKNGPPPLDAAPIVSETHGLGAVPVWFVDWSELRAATGDHVLRIAELRDLSTLRKGFASFYQETLHPAGGARVDMKDLVARGALMDGTAFEIHVTAEPGGANIALTFR